MRQASASAAAAAVEIPERGLSVLHVVGDRVETARIESAGLWPDGVMRYRVKLWSQGGLQWAIERRYSEFLQFRDKVC
jgi:hypothetical protein